MNKLLSLSLLLVLMLLCLAQTTAQGVQVWIPHKGHYIIESISEAEGYLDPAWAYDEASGALISNIYESLMIFNREKTNEFVPALAKNWTVTKINVPVLLTDGIDPETGLLDPDHNHHSGQSIVVTYVEKLTFTVRLTNITGQPVYFHSGDTLKMEDVEYSFERWMVQDRSGGPTWMINEPVMGIGKYHVNPTDPLQDEIIDSAFRLTLLTPSAGVFEIWLTVRYPPILGILAQYWASIVNKSFMISYGDWPGTWINWFDPHWHNPPAPPVGDNEDGPGPYSKNFDFGQGPGYWSHGWEWSIVRFPGYWGGWPYEHASNYLTRVTEKFVYEWSTRMADFRAGSADTVYVPRQYISWIEDWPGVRGLKDLPTLSADAMFFNFNINPDSPYVGTQQFPLGIPLGFFNDTRIRKGFAHIFNYTEFLERAWRNEAVQPSSLVIEGIPYHVDVTKYSMNIPLAIEEFTEASNDPESPAHRVMDLGFYFELPYIRGDASSSIAADIIKRNIQLVAPPGIDFHIEIFGVDKPRYLREIWYYPTQRSILPIFFISRSADYADPHDWVMPFMHRIGHFTYPSSYSNSTVDTLIEVAIGADEGWGPGQRGDYYTTLQWMYYQEIPSVCLAQPLGRRWERDWVQGWYHNPLYGEAIDRPYFYHLWEGLNGDIAGDGDVDAADWALVMYYWWDPPMVGPAGYYEPKADVSPPLMYIEGMLPPPGTSVGLVETLDLAMLNAHWMETDP